MKSGLINVKIPNGFIPDRIIEGVGTKCQVEYLCIPLHKETGRYKKIQLDLIEYTKFDDLGNVEIYMTNGEMFGTKVSSIYDDGIRDLQKLQK